MSSTTFKSITGYESIRKNSLHGDIDGGYGPGNVFCNLFNGCGAIPPSGPGYIPFPVTDRGDIENYQLTQEFQLVSNSSGPLNWQTGVYVFYDDAKGEARTYDQTGTQLVNTTGLVQRNDAEAVFGHIEYQVTDALKLAAGARFTWDNKTFSVPYSDANPPLPQPLSAEANAHKFNWDVSAVYQFNPDINLYARVATGFRAPSFGMPAAGPPPIPVQVANSEDNPSTSRMHRCATVCRSGPAASCISTPTGSTAQRCTSFWIVGRSSLRRR